MRQPVGFHQRVSRTDRFLVCLAGALVTASYAAAAANAVQTINGSPLTINIGDDTSMQVIDTSQGDTNYVFGPTCTTAASGVFVSVGAEIFAPAAHCDGVVDLQTPWTPVSISPVTGSGTPADPFTVSVVVDAGTTGLRLTETLTYVNGSTTINPSLTFSNTGAGTVVWNTFLKADVAHTTHGILANGAPGAQWAGHVGAPSPACGEELPYYILFPPADRYSSNLSEQVWNEISSGTLSNTIEPGCVTNAVASEWTDRTLGPGETLVVNDRGGIAFVPAQPTATAAVPVLSWQGLAALAAGLAVAGWSMSRRTN